MYLIEKNDEKKYQKYELWFCDIYLFINNDI